MLELRVHHLFEFTRAVVSKSYRKEYLRTSYSKEQREDIRIILQSVTDSTKIKIVTGIDDICHTCPHLSSIQTEDCEFPDSLWAAKEFMYKVQPNEVVTLGYLKQQYTLYQSVRQRQDSKKIITDSRRPAK